ncbi:hypothetical protein [Shewanella kaireitica]|uniref:hypothetical protein n=1 Tax=Shewanella kaireitica TaxID=212021 RepID=UPI00201013DC|nr:hypothetical protein [Shewanella kaireitica]MCL1095857.1 hypothetical protein [Shewanella kaireitica]
MNRQIQQSELKKGCYYLGRGRNGNIGLWDGEVFAVLHLETIRKTNSSGQVIGSYTQPHIKKEPYYTDESGCFQPFSEIFEGRLIPFTDKGAGSFYGQYLDLVKP